MQKIYLESIPIVKPTIEQIQEIEMICKKAIEKYNNVHDGIINKKIFTLYDFSKVEIDYIINDIFEPLTR
jgi:hypothetical protein